MAEAVEETAMVVVEVVHSGRAAEAETALEMVVGGEVARLVVVVRVLVDAGREVAVEPVDLVGLEASSGLVAGRVENAVVAVVEKAVVTLVAWVDAVMEAEAA